MARVADCFGARVVPGLPERCGPKPGSTLSGPGAHRSQVEACKVRDEALSFTSADGLVVRYYRWSDAKQPRAAVQIAHGLGEHALRYRRLAEALVADGYVVYAVDHRGHGRTATDRKERGRFGPDGWNRLVADIGQLVEIVRTEHRGVPLALYGHSMGSFAVQQFILDHSDQIDAVVLSGTGAGDALAGAIDTTKPLELGAFNAAFEPARTPFDWLSRDATEVDAYIADPLCGFGTDAQGTADLVAGLAASGDPARLAQLRSDLPMYIFAGDADPVNAGLVLLTMLEERYRAAGLRDLTVKVYPGGRHEMLNETNRDEVTTDLLTWLGRVVGDGARSRGS